MRSLLLLSLALAAPPALAQSSGAGVNSGPSGPIGYRGPVSAGRVYIERADILRAAAWGRCVVAVAPDASRGYAGGEVASRTLRTAFGDCRRQTGDFDLSYTSEVKRAAISDALRAG